jgi:putative transposase
MSANNLNDKVKRRFKSTAHSNHGLSISPNRLKQQFSVKYTDVWVGDITYILPGKGWLYLALVIDLFSYQVAK